jgi:hypothetical protein
MIGVALSLVFLYYMNIFAKARTENEIKAKILKALLTELKDYLLMLIEYNDPDTQKDDMQRSRLSVELKTETYRAFSDGGELGHINDVLLLDDLAACYHFVEEVKMFSLRFFEMTNSKYLGSVYQGTKAAMDDAAEKAITRMDRIIILYGKYWSAE